jgi:hypothetical protein
MSPTEYEQLVEFLSRQFTEIDRRFDLVDGQIADLRREMLGHFDELYHRLERLEQEYHATPGDCAGSRQAWPTRAVAARSSRASWPS